MELKLNPNLFLSGNLQSVVGTTEPISTSYALNSNAAVSATTASYGSGSLFAVAALSASYALSASWAPGGGASVSSSYAATASYQNPMLQTVTFTTPSITPGAFYSTSLQITTPYYTIIAVSSSVNSRLCAYINTQSMVNDQTRSFTQQPSASTGVLMDVVFTGSFGRNVPLSPVVTGYNYEGTPLTAIPVNITNLEPTAQTVTVAVAYTTF